MITDSRIEQVLDEMFAHIEFQEEPATLYDPLRYMIALEGKRLRPELCLTTYSLYKDEFNDAILMPASGLEIFHNFTLVHDDIMDKSDLRRGVSTVWKKWGNDIALLSGDVMCIESFRRICGAPSAVLGKVLDLFADTASEVCDGQQYDMDFERKETVSMEEYTNMIGLKTGVLAACAAEMGALIGGASEDECVNLYEYGYNLGLAFQVADDYLDTYGDAKVFGKPIGGDILNNKKSWLTVRALEKAGVMTEQAFAEIFKNTGIDCSKRKLLEVLSSKAVTEEQKKEKIASVKAIYNALGVDEDAKYEILRLNDRAIMFASKACSGVKLEVLKRFAGKLVGRTK